MLFCRVRVAAMVSEYSLIYLFLLPRIKLQKGSARFQTASRCSSWKLSFPGRTRAQGRTHSPKVCGRQPQTSLSPYCFVDVGKEKKKKNPLYLWNMYRVIHVVNLSRSKVWIYSQRWRPSASPPRPSPSQIFRIGQVDGASVDLKRLLVQLRLKSRQPAALWYGAHRRISRSLKVLP